MNKTIIIIGILIAALAYAEATRCRSKDGSKKGENCGHRHQVKKPCRSNCGKQEHRPAIYGKDGSRIGEHHGHRRLVKQPCRSNCGKQVHRPVRYGKDGSKIQESHGHRRLVKKQVHRPVRHGKEGSKIRENYVHPRQVKKPSKLPSPISCRNIKGVKVRCPTKKRGPRSIKPRRCQHINCPGGSKKLNCYSDKQNRCQLLSPCKVERANCLRGRNNLLEWVDLRRCAGMKAGQGLKKCRPGPRRS